ELHAFLQVPVLVADEAPAKEIQIQAGGFLKREESRVDIVKETLCRGRRCKGDHDDEPGQRTGESDRQLVHRSPHNQSLFSARRRSRGARTHRGAHAYRARGWRHRRHRRYVPSATRTSRSAESRGPGHTEWSGRGSVIRACNGGFVTGGDVGE